MSGTPLLPAAREEFLETADRYDAQSPGLGEEFIAAVERAAERIASFPEHGSAYIADTRRIVLRRFPYSVVYQAEPEGTLIVAVAHQSRRPGYWHDRLETVLVLTPASTPPERQPG